MCLSQNIQFKEDDPHFLPELSAACAASKGVRRVRGQEDPTSTPLSLAPPHSVPTQYLNTRRVRTCWAPPAPHPCSRCCLTHQTPQGPQRSCQVSLRPLCASRAPTVINHGHSFRHRGAGTPPGQGGAVCTADGLLTLPSAVETLRRERRSCR